jgi:hypothetical protein
VNESAPPPTMDYDVRWDIELEASSPQEAAAIALAIHRDPASIATNFQVRPAGSELPWVEIDVQATP